MALVDAGSGLVTALAAGVAEIVATLGVATARATVAVLAAATVGLSSMSSVDVVVARPAIAVGEATTATTIVRDSAGRTLPGRTVTWQSGNSAVLLVDVTGRITGIAPGSTTVRAIVDGVAGEEVVTVIAPPPPPATGSDEPVYRTATDRLILRDNFDGYSGITSGARTFTSRYPNYRALALRGGSMPLNNVVSLVAGRGATGNALRLLYGAPGGSQDIVVGPEGRLRTSGGWDGKLPEVAGPYHHFLFTTWIRFSPGAQPAMNASGVKGVMFWHTGGQRYQHSPHRIKDFRGNVYPYPDTRWDAGPPHPPNTTTGMNHWRTRDGEAPRFAPYADGNWHRFTVEIYTGGRSGRMGERWWLDGVLVFDNLDKVGDRRWGTDYDYRHPITHWMVFGNYVNSSVALGSPAFTVDFDDWIAWTR